MAIGRSGQSHLINPIKNAQKILVVPPGFETLGMDANTGRVFLAQQIQADMAEHREIFVGMTESDARFILPKSDIEDPMQAVFNAPVTSDRSGKGFD
jgi:hypothetical protein